MRVFRHENLPEEFRGAVVAIGNFDGVHLGHRAVIGEAASIAASAKSPWGVLTFEPHPRQVFQPDIEPFRLTPFHIKARHIEELGAEFLVVLQFSLDFSKGSAANFVQGVLREGFDATHVVSGHDFVFGHKRLGTSAFLQKCGAELGFETTGVNEVRDDAGEVISSTRIRTFLANGEPRAAEALLGRTFEISGRVIHGDARGRTIGYPTANVALTTHIRPATGVYAVRTGIDQGTDTIWHDGVANLGYKPTFGGTHVGLETHLFDFEGDLFGRHLRVALVDYLRAEKKFSGIDELKAQIDRDSADARRILAA